MEISRRAPGEASLVLDGREILDLLQAEGSEAEFDRALDALDAVLRAVSSPPRVVVQYKEGLFGGVQADCAVHAILIEDDPHDEPPLSVLHREIAADPTAVDAMLAAAERRLRLAGQAGAA